MQQITLHKKLYHISGIDEAVYSKGAYERFEKLKLFKKVRSEGCSLETAFCAIDVKRATFYRWRKQHKLLGLRGLEYESRRPNNPPRVRWKEHVKQLILQLRRTNPLYGKDKLVVLLKRDHDITISKSTVGRILAYWIKKDKIKPAHFYFNHKRVRPRVFNNHAQRWKHGMKAKNPGELFQIDHMSITVFPGVAVKHFQGICPITKMVVEQAYSSATSAIAKQFLEYTIASLPFKIQSIQVDGGSEFRKDFEQECNHLSIPLFVLPPRSPKYNGTVERANGAAKYEFYALYAGIGTLNHLRKHLQLYVQKYNRYRPHQALHYLTPLQYYSSLSRAS